MGENEMTNIKEKKDVNANNDFWAQKIKNHRDQKFITFGLSLKDVQKHP